MSDIGEERASAVQLVDAAQIRLIERLGVENAKDYELLSYLYLKFNSEREYAWQALLRRFSKDPNAEGNVKGAIVVTYALSQYLFALEIALGERTPSPQVEAKVDSRDFLYYRNDGLDGLPF